MPPTPQPSSPLSSALAIAVAALLLQGCDIVSGPRSGHARVTIDLRTLAGALAPDDRITVIGGARLTVEADGRSQTFTNTLEPTDSTTSFDVSVAAGAVRFRLEIVSTTDVRLYQADTTASVTADGFDVTILPRPVNAVLVIEPRDPPVQTFNVGQGRVAVARWRIRNAGNQPLVWNVDSLATPGVIGCLAEANPNASCLQPISWNVVAGRDSIQVSFFTPAGGQSATRQVTFTSNVGRVTFTTAVP